MAIIAFILTLLALAPSTLASLIQCTCGGYTYKTTGTCSTSTGYRFSGTSKITLTAPSSCYFDSACYSRTTTNVSCWDITLTIVIASVVSLVICGGGIGWFCWKKKKSSSAPQTQTFVAAPVVQHQYGQQEYGNQQSYQQQPNYPPPQQQPYIQEPSYPPPSKNDYYQSNTQAAPGYQQYQQPTFAPPSGGPGGYQEPSGPPPGFKN
ncbi:UNVERIFIED_CONTAM: hypothetical protein HDU68_005129 [Siphonaria sp. JEL0065]|nr:hypothetical protein HDU68_005129 [Siphonaria sp. JEL0065]